MESILNLESLYEEHKKLIKSTIWRNRTLLTALKLEDDDVSQQLAIAMITAIRKFDPKRSKSLSSHIRHCLQFEILNIKRRHKPCGITGVPRGQRLNFLYLDNDISDECSYDLPYEDDLSEVEISDLIDGLSELETEAVNLKMGGYPIRKKKHITALDNVCRRYTDLYAS